MISGFVPTMMASRNDRQTATNPMYGSSAQGMHYNTSLPSWQQPSGSTSYNAPVFNGRAANELWDRIGAGDFNVAPVDPYQDAFIQRTMSGIQSEGRRAGLAAANQLMRQVGGAGRQQGALLGLIGESQGIRDANQLALEEGRFRTGVLEGNADRALSALGTLGGLDLGKYNADIDSQRARLGYIQQGLAERQAAFDAGLAGRAEERATDEYGWNSGYRQRQEDRLSRQFEQDLAQDAERFAQDTERFGWERDAQNDADRMQNQRDALLRQFQEEYANLTGSGGYDQWLNMGRSLGDLFSIRARLAGLGVDVGRIPVGNGGFY